MIDIEKISKTNALFDGHYQLIRPLSTDGGTADVWLAIDTNTIDSEIDTDDEQKGSNKDSNSGMMVAIKIYRPKNALDIEGEQRFRDEYKVVYECRHENLLQPTSFSIYEGTPYLVLPYCKYGSSEQLIGKKQSNDEIWKFISDVTSGLNRLHTNDPQIIHQDIKPANVLIDNSKNFVITDFGISSKRGGSHNYYYDDENSGTLAYMAPERFREDVEPIAASDIWAFGATLCEILTGEVPFGEEGGSKQVGNNLPTFSNTDMPKDVQKLILACLSFDPEKRPSAAEIKKAAMAKQYPVKSKKWIYLFGSVLAVVLMVAVFFLLTPEPKPKTLTNEEAYGRALENLNSSNPDRVKHGVIQMDSLCNKDFIPALYEMAFTYGWFSDSKSLRRKELLGIEIFENEQERYLPKDDRYNDKAVRCFQRIVELKDSAYSDINAQAAFRLACYYGMQNKIFNQNLEKARFFLELSYGWASVNHDTAMMSKAKEGIDRINAYIEENQLTK